MSRIDLSMVAMVGVITADTKEVALIMEGVIREAMEEGTSSLRFILQCMDFTHHQWTITPSNNTTIRKVPI
jgi:hypothetical protein